MSAEPQEEDIFQVEADELRGARALPDRETWDRVDCGEPGGGSRASLAALHDLLREADQMQRVVDRGARCATASALCTCKTAATTSHTRSVSA